MTVSALLSTTLEFLSLILFHRVGLNYIAMGPAPLVFSMLYQYARIVPSAYNFRIFGVPLNSKSLLYILALQVRMGTIISVAQTTNRYHILTLDPLIDGDQPST